MATEAQPVEGVALTSVTVTAASPDVVGTLMKRITEEVMKTIPEGALANIASEVLKQGKIVYECRRDAYGDTREKAFVLSEAAARETEKLLQAEIVRQVNLYLAEDAIKQVASTCIREGVKQALVNLPYIAAKKFGERLGTFVVGALDPSVPEQDILLSIQESLMRTQRALASRGVIDLGSDT